MEILSSRHFPESMQGNLLVANVIGFQGILRIRIEDKDSSFTGIHEEPILSSTDVNFRPSDVRIGPDGAIYFIDWHNPIIGHMQHNLRDPSRDRIHGRIYRVTYEGRPLLKSPKIAGEPIEKLLDLLKEPEDRVRYRTRIELTGRDSDQVLAAVKKWVEKLDAKDAEYQHNLLEALWLHQSHNVVNADLLKRLLESPDFHARAAATRLLGTWRDRVPESLAMLKLRAADPHPRVRLEAVRAASFYRVPEAIEVVLIAMDHPSDIYLDFLRGETVKALDPFVKKAIAAGKTIPFTTTAGARYFLKNVATSDLLKMPRNQAVFVEMLFRKGVRDEFRQEALTGLAKLDNKSELTVLLDTVALHDEQTGNMEDSVMFDLARLLTARPAKDLKTVRKELEKLATTARTPLTRQLGLVALIAADTTVEPAWKLGTQSVRALEDLLHAMPLIRDPGQRSDLYPKVQPLLKGLPPSLAATVKESTTVMGRYVRIELPGKKKTLTLAEVEVYSDGRNIARQGKATQKTTAFGGDAGRAIDGNKSDKYGDGGQTHTQENDDNPWWELDLGAAFPINAIAIYNRTDGGLGNRLAGFTLKVLDKDRSVTFELKKQPAPPKNVVYQVGGQSPERIVRWATMTALLSVRGQETNTFKELAPFLGSDVDRHAAMQAMLRIPLMYWPKENVRPLLDTLLTYVRKIPVKERTTGEVLDAVQMADSLASLLPLAEAKAVRKELGALAVRVVRIGTVPDQMRFDKERLVVKAGAQAEILFENTDLMPHNLVVVQPGALEEIGLLAEETATQADAMARQYVPKSSKVLFKSRLLQPRESEKLSFKAPSKPGVYPIVCTYPGHWRRMYGALYVVEDLDEYLADPTGYLAKNPLPIADELLKFTRPRTEWKFEDLASSVEKLEPGRSFGNGKQMFQVANCLACHKMNGVGLEIGPDLTKIDPKQMKPIEILRDILEPSFRINEKYQSYVVEMKNGKVFTGLIVKETPEMVKLLENPLAKAAPLVLKVAEIDTRKKSPTSIMPKGLLDQLTRDEILDLVAYIFARGDPQHAVWQGGHEGHKGH
jgi:putative heme-binding domain-containing protein